MPDEKIVREHADRSRGDFLQRRDLEFHFDSRLRGQDFAEDVQRAAKA